MRRRLEREHAAAVTIQRAVRAHQDRRRQAAVAAVKQQMAEMAALMREYQRRTASALRIQVRARLEVVRNRDCQHSALRQLCGSGLKA